jgi:hypothetical protein
VMWLRANIPTAGDPTKPAFWFVMSMGLLVGFIVAYPMNWWLVTNHLKHGMMTVRPKMVMTGAGGAHAGHAGGGAAATPAMDMSQKSAPRPPVPVMGALSFLAFAIGLAIALAARALG